MTHGAVIPGYLFDADQYDYSIFSRWEYNYTTKTFEYSGKTWEKNDIGPIHDNVIWVTFEAKDYGTLYKADSIISVQFIPKDNTKFDIVHAFFYIRSPYTIIKNGVLDIDNTFSGDYAIINNNDKNTDKIIDNDRSLYDKMFKISGDKIDGIFQEAMTKIEIESGEVAEFEVIKNYLQGEPGDFIISWRFIYAKPYDKRKTRLFWRWKHFTICWRDDTIKSN